MSPRKTAAAALAFMASGISAISLHSKSAATVTAEPQLVGSTTSDGVLLYSFNYCTTVQSTTCGITLSTGAVSASSPGYTTLTSLSGDSTTVITVSVPFTLPQESNIETTTSVAAGTNTSPSSAHWTAADPAATSSASPDVGVPATNGQTSASPSVVVISTTDAAGSPTSLTSTASAAPDPTTTGGTTTTFSSSLAASVTSLSSGHGSSSKTPSSSVAQSKTGSASNTTVTGSHEPSSTTTGDNSAPSKTGAGSSFQMMPAIAFGAVTLVAMIFFI